MQRGFSFIELIVVLSIFAIIAAMAVPRLGNSVAMSELEDAAQQVAADIRWTQQRVINRGDSIVTPTITYFANQYRIEAGLGNFLRPVVVFPVSVRSTTLFTLTFTLEGRPANASIILQSQTDRSQFRRILVESLTGRVRVVNTL